MSVAPGFIGECPRCGVRQQFQRAVEIRAGGYHLHVATKLRVRQGEALSAIFTDGHEVDLYASACSACHELIVYTLSGGDETIVVPVGSPRPVPPEVEAEDAHLAADFREATTIVHLSPKASAALARRCMETILEIRAGATNPRLVDKVDYVLKSPEVPPYVKDHLHAARNIGNFGAHRKTDVITGEVLDVEPGEAEWMISVVEMLFDHYYVQPAKYARQGEALQTKIARTKKS